MSPFDVRPLSAFVFSFLFSCGFFLGAGLYLGPQTPTTRTTSIGSTSLGLMRPLAPWSGAPTRLISFRASHLPSPPGSRASEFPTSAARWQKFAISAGQIGHILAIFRGVSVVKNSPTYLQGTRPVKTCLYLAAPLNQLRFIVPATLKMLETIPLKASNSSMSVSCKGAAAAI